MALRSDTGTQLLIRGISVPRTASAATEFIGQNPTLIPTLTGDERGDLLKSLATGISATPTVENKCAMTEAAALRLLQTAPASQLAQIASGLGGAAWIQANVTRFTNPDLRSMAMSVASSAFAAGK